MLILIAYIFLITLTHKAALPSFVNKLRVEVSYPSSDMGLSTLTFSLGTCIV